MGHFLGTLNIRGRIIMGIQKGTIILTTTHIRSPIKAIRENIKCPRGLPSQVWRRYSAAGPRATKLEYTQISAITARVLEHFGKQSGQDVPPKGARKKTSEAHRPPT